MSKKYMLEARVISSLDNKGYITELEVVEHPEGMTSNIIEIEEE